MSDEISIGNGAGEIPKPPAGVVLSFHGHRQALFGIVSDLKRLREIAAEEGNAPLAGVIGQVLGHVEQQGFSVAVVGEFKRGKSTFINALLGKEILPADVTPTSATINRVTYGLKPGVRIVFRANGDQAERVEEVPIDQLAGYVTKLTPEAEAVAATVKEAVVSYPVPFCRNNVDLIDTPGLNDDPAMTRVTLGILPAVDAAILVTLATSPFALSEGEFLDQLLLEHGLGSVLFVVTALDRIRKPEDRERIVAAVAARIEERIAKLGEERFGRDTEDYRQFLKRVGRPRVFGISGYEALQAKISHDSKKLSESRFPELEAALERFLTEESGLVILKTQAERIAGFCKEILTALDARTAALAARPAVAAGEVLSALLDAVQQMGRDELRAVDAALGKTREAARQSLGSYASRLKEAADLFVSGAQIQPGHLEPAGFPEIRKWLLSELSAKLSEVAQATAARLHLEVRSGVEAEAARLLSFALAADRTLEHVRNELARSGGAAAAGPPPVPLTTRLGGRAGFSVVPAPPGNEPALPGPDKDELARELALPPDWTAAVNVKVEEPPNNRVMRKISDFFKVDAFKKELRGHLATVIDAKVRERQPLLAGALDRHVQTSFEALRREVEIVSGHSRNLAVELHGLKERAQGIGEVEAKRLERVRSEVRRIRESARSLAVQLNEIGS